MKKFITLIAVLIISAGFSPAASSLFGQDQGEYGQFSQGQGAPPPPSNQDYGQSQDQQQGPQPDSAQNAQEVQADASSQPGVARASYIHGDVSSQRGDNSQLVPVTLNTPLEAGDSISTAHDARTEIELDYGDQLRLSGDATAKIASLSRQNIQVQVGQGLATYSVLPGGQAQVEIDTPNAALHPDGQGDYRVLVNSDAETKIIVRSGAADVSTPQGSTHVEAGQMITIAGTDSPQYRIDSAPGRDDWDSWNMDRDHRVQTAQSFKNTDPYYTGSEDLDTYGTWSEVPDYGNVWFPNNNGGDWAPYRDGSWVYEPYYGWTWVSSEPWGWAPYHYGRWSVYGGRWGWWPGAAYAGYYPVWSPAYVSFFGWGGGGVGLDFGYGFGGWGRIGWCPIGPGDWYHPWYGRFGGRFNAIGFRDYNNVHNGFGPLRGGRGFSNINNAFTNDRVRNGISSMSGSEFGRGRVPAGQGRISEADFRGARAMTGRVPMTPSRESYSPTGRAANASEFHSMSSSSQRFYTANRGFVGGNSAARTQNGFSGNNTARSGAASSQGTRPNGWRTFTPPSSANRSGQGSQSQGFNRGATENRGAVQNRAPADNRGAVQNRGANSGGWQQFTPQSRQSQPQGNYSRPNEPSRNYQSPQTSRGSNSYSRPTLNMRQPVVAPRGGSYGGGNSAPRGGNYSAPRGGGGSNYSAPRGGGGNYSAPRGGGGSGGGSAPRGGGGGGGSRSSGGHGGRR